MNNNLARASILLVGMGLAVLAAHPTDSGKAGAVNPASGAKPVLWRDTADASSLNLLYGSGGVERQPVGPFIFIEEDTDGTNPKIEVRDQNGVEWKVKLGAEARPEVVATRLVWAAGYFTTDDYFLPILHVQDLPNHLHRGQELVAPDHTLRNVRLKRSPKGAKKVGTWEWGSNPFVDTREFNGLRTLMALINDWDVKDVNNAIYERRLEGESAAPEHIYLVSDLGATFGTIGFIRSLDRSRGNLETYKDSEFITNAGPDFVDFGAPGRPALIETLNLPTYIRRLDLRWIGRHIPREDAKWMGGVLARLSPEQIRDAFRAGGYSPEEVNEFATVVENRIRALNAL